MVVRVVARVHGDDCCWGATVWEHADEDEIGVVDPVECGVLLCFQTGFLQKVNTDISVRKVRIGFVIDIFGGMDVCYGGFVRVGVCRDFNLVVERGPVCSL